VSSPITCVLTVAAIGLAAAGAGAQGLGQAASAAAAERKASEGKPAVKLSDKNLPPLDRFELELRAYVLTEDQLSAYASARTDILQMRERSAELDDVLLQAEGRNDPLELERLLADRLIRTLDFLGITPRAYVLTEVTFRRALADAALSDPEIERLPPTRAENARWVRKHDVKIGNITYQWGEKEKWLNWRRSTRTRR
jgi:hypothetical protein